MVSLKKEFRKLRIFYKRNRISFIHFIWFIVFSITASLWMSEYLDNKRLQFVLTTSENKTTTLLEIQNQLIELIDNNKKPNYINTFELETE